MVKKLQLQMYTDKWVPSDRMNQLQVNSAVGESQSNDRVGSETARLDEDDTGCA